MKKINFKSVSSTLSQKEMKNVLGGSGVTITCHQHPPGYCWICPPGHIPVFTGNMSHHCPDWYSWG